jgi:hypothetical protein
MKTRRGDVVLVLFPNSDSPTAKRRPAVVPTRLIALAEESCNNVKVSTITEIQEAIDKLPAKERSALDAWLRSQDQPRMSEREEAALLASLDKAATELDAGHGVPFERVREMVGRWLTK